MSNLWIDRYEITAHIRLKMYTSKKYRHIRRLGIFICHWKLDFKPVLYCIISQISLFIISVNVIKQVIQYSDLDIGDAKLENTREYTIPFDIRKDDANSQHEILLYSQAYQGKILYTSIELLPNK